MLPARLGTIWRQIVAHLRPRAWPTNIPTLFVTHLVVSSLQCRRQFGRSRWVRSFVRQYAQI
jgi:hypothetical protein